MPKYQVSLNSLWVPAFALVITAGLLIFDAQPATAASQCANRSTGLGAITVEPSPVTAGSPISITDTGFKDDLGANLIVCGPDGQVVFFNETRTGFVHRALVEASWPAGTYTVAMSISGTDPTETAVQTFEVTSPPELSLVPELTVVGDVHVITGEKVSLMASVDNLPSDQPDYETAWLDANFALTTGPMYSVTFDQPGTYDVVAIAVHDEQRLEVPVSIIVADISCDGEIEDLSVTPQQGPPGTIVDVSFLFVPTADPQFADACVPPRAEILIGGTRRDGVDSDAVFTYVAREPIDATAQPGQVDIEVTVGDATAATIAFTVVANDPAAPVRSDAGPVANAPTTSPPDDGLKTSVAGVLPAAIIALIVALSIGAGSTAILRSRPDQR